MSCARSPVGGPTTWLAPSRGSTELFSYLGALSTDRFGVLLREGLRDDGVNDRWAPFTEDPTTLAVAQIGETGGATYSFVERTSASDLSAEQAVAVLPQTPRCSTSARSAWCSNRRRPPTRRWSTRPGLDVLVAVDPNCRPAVIRDPDAYRARLARVLARADIVKVSTEDLDYLTPDLDHLGGAGSCVTSARPSCCSPTGAATSRSWPRAGSGSCRFLRSR
jgi:fructokinase